MKASGSIFTFAWIRWDADQTTFGAAFHVGTSKRRFASGSVRSWHFLLLQRISKWFCHSNFNWKSRGARFWNSALMSEPCLSWFPQTSDNTTSSFWSFSTVRGRKKLNEEFSKVFLSLVALWVNWKIVWANFSNMIGQNWPRATFFYSSEHSQ